MNSNTIRLAAMALLGALTAIFLHFTFNPLFGPADASESCAAPGTETDAPAAPCEL